MHKFEQIWNVIDTFSFWNLFQSLFLLVKVKVGYLLMQSVLLETVLLCSVWQETEMAGVKTESSPNQDKRPVQKVIPSRNLNYNSTPPAAALVS